MSAEPLLEKSFLISAITVTLCSLWPTLINTALGVASHRQGPDERRPRAAAAVATTVRKIVLPSALPLIFTGLRLSLGVGWMVLIAAEMLAQNPGLGKFVWDEFQNGSSDSLARIMVAVLTIGIIGFLLDRTDAARCRRPVTPRDASGERPHERPRRPRAARRVPSRYGAGAHAPRSSAASTSRSAEGEFVAIVGFSGSGKTTLDLADRGPDRARQRRGAVRAASEVAGAGPERGVVFQSYSLMPWLTVRGNVALAVDAVRARRVARASAGAVVDRYVAMVGLAHAARPAARRSSRAACASAWPSPARSPCSRELLLLDEPLSALDALTRAKLQDEIAAISAREKKTVVLITNDVDEAILLADRIIPLNPGPGATLGPEFRGRLARPRDRGALNHDAEFTRLRAAITRYLLDAGAGGRSRARRSELALPSVRAELTPLPAEDDPPRPTSRPRQCAADERYVEFYRGRKIFPDAARVRSPSSTASTSR